MCIAFAALVHLCLFALEVVEVGDTVFSPVDIVHGLKEYGIAVVGEEFRRDSGKTVSDGKHIHSALSAADEQFGYSRIEIIFEVTPAIVEDYNTILKVLKNIGRVLVVPYMPHNAVPQKIVRPHKRIFFKLRPLCIVGRYDKYLQPLTAFVRLCP